MRALFVFDLLGKTSYDDKVGPAGKVAVAMGHVGRADSHLPSGLPVVVGFEGSLTLRGEFSQQQCNISCEVLWRACTRSPTVGGTLDLSS